MSICILEVTEDQDALVVTMTIKLRKGRGKPIERRVFYLTDEFGKIHFEFWTPSLVFTEKPKTKKPDKRYKTILNLRNLQLSIDKETGIPAIAIFHGMHPTRKQIAVEELSKLIKALLSVYYIIYNKETQELKKLEDMIK